MKKNIIVKNFEIFETLKKFKLNKIIILIINVEIKFIINDENIILV